MKRFKKCFDRDKHDLQFILDSENVTEVYGWLDCKDCNVSIRISEDVLDINGEAISDIIAEEEEAYQTAEDDSRIQSGLN